MLYVESDTVELKKEVTKDLTKEVIAFANTYGGKIYIGIDDDGEVVGLPDTQYAIEQISSMINDQISPSVIGYVHIYEMHIKGSNVLCVEVQRGEGKPYYLSRKGMRSAGVYTRLGNTSIPVSDVDIRRMVANNHGITYETTRSLIQTLTFNYVDEEFGSRDIGFSDKHKKTLGLIDEEGQYTNLALLLSDQCPHIIKAAVFQDHDKTIFKHRQEFGGSLLKQLKDVFLFVEMQNHMTTTYEGLRRIDVHDYDSTALREGLVNAIVHRDYGVGGHIFVNCEPSSIEFISLGGLPSGILYEDIMAGVSKCRNEKLANVFYRLELIEAYGTGVRKIIHAYRHHPNKPTFHVTPNAFILTLPKMTLEMNGLKEAKGYYDTNRFNQSFNIYDRDRVKEQILEGLADGAYITRQSVQSIYGFSQTKSGKILRELEEAGQIIKKGKGKNIHYISHPS